MTIRIDKTIRSLEEKQFSSRPFKNILCQCPRCKESTFTLTYNPRIKKYYVVCHYCGYEWYFNKEDDN